MNSKALLFVILTLIPTSISANLFTRSSPVLPLTNTGPNSLKSTLSNGYPAIVAFTAPWCGYCQKLVPEFERAADSLKPLVGFYNVDCEEDVNKGLCAKEDVKGFPTIKTYAKGSLGPSRPYQGPREAKDFVDHASSLIPMDKCRKMKTKSDLDDWRAKSPSTPHILLLHPSNPSIPLLWRTLSSRLSPLSFGFLRDEGGKIKQSLGIDISDAKRDGVRVIWWNEEGEMREYEAGPLKYEPLFAFFLDIAKKINPSYKEPGSSSSTKSAKSSSKTSSSSSSSSPSPSISTTTLTPAERKAKNLADMELKWREEERRDSLRREKKEAERLEKLLSDQERLSPDEIAIEEEEVESEKRERDLQEKGDRGQSAETPLDEEAQMFAHGVSDSTTGEDVHDKEIPLSSSGPRDVAPPSEDDLEIDRRMVDSETDPELLDINKIHNDIPSQADLKVEVVDDGISTAADSPDGYSESPIGDDGKSAGTFLEEEAEEFDHGTSEARVHEEL